jgi:cytochrome c553
MIKSILTAAALAAAAFFGSGDARAADPARGRTLAEPCIACHGSPDVPGVAGTPFLAGQPPTFLTLQMILFREDIRQVEVMNAITKGLSDGDIEDIAAFFASQPPTHEPSPRDDARFARGQALSQTMRCGTCHLSDYRGREQMPRLAGQREDYLQNAMQQFRDNLRAGTDTTMNGVLYGVADTDLAALAHYLAQLK